MTALPCSLGPCPRGKPCKLKVRLDCGFAQAEWVKTKCEVMLAEADGWYDPDLEGKS